ncbi:MAG: DUF4132 domain-containing protein [Lachnospiraceae bacterium]|nr:DUF4132 domain-containing protein [Lachnospiraceae bacterium]
MGETFELYQAVAERIKKEKEALVAQTSPKFQDLVKVSLNSTVSSSTGVEKEFYQALKEGTPSAFFKKYDKDVKQVLKADLLPLFYVQIDRVRDFQYSDSMYRRSFRSRDYKNYDKKILSILQEFMNFSALGVPMSDYLGEKTSADIIAYKNIYQISRFAFVIGALIDSGDEALCETIEDIVMNSGGTVRIEMIRGIFLSNNVKMYDLMGKLLLAARLQEGLRQAVCENMDFGTRAAFDYIFNIIVDNDLLRFSSVQRALQVCTGLIAMEERGGERINKKQCALIGKYLKDTKEREQAFHSDDHMEVYLALWAMGTECIEEACERAVKLVFEGDREQQLTAAYFLKLYSTESTAILRILKAKSDEPDMVAILMSQFMSNLYFAITRSVKAPNGKHREYVDHRVFADPTLYFSDEAEARSAYDTLKKILSLIPNKKIEFKGIVFPWNDEELTKTDCITRMVFCASAAQDKTLTREVVKDITSVDSDVRECALALLLNEPETKEEYEILTKEVGDAEEFARRRAYMMLDHELKRDTTGLDAEIRAGIGALPELCYKILEDLLRLKRSDVRQNAITLLMTREDGDKVEMIGRLLSDKSEEKRTAALDMLLQLKKENAPCFAKASEKLTILTSPTTKEQVLLDEIRASSEEAASGQEDGLGLFDPSATYEPVIDLAFIEECNEAWDRVFPNKKIGKKTKSSDVKFEERKIFEDFDAFIIKHKNKEYEAWNGTRLLGDGIAVSYEEGKPILPYPELWAEFYEKSIGSEEELLRLSWIMERNANKEKTEEVRGFSEYCNRYLEEYFDAKLLTIDYKDLKYHGSFRTVVSTLCRQKNVSDLNSKIGCAIAYHIANEQDPMLFTFKKEDITSKYGTNLDMEIMTRTPLMDHGFTFFLDGIARTLQTFPIRYILLKKFDGNYMRDASLRRYYTINESYGKMSVPSIGDYITACANGLISKDFLYKRFFDGFEKETLELLSSVIIFIRESNDAKSTRVRSYSGRINVLVRSLLGRVTSGTAIDPATLTKSDKKTLALAEECYETMIAFCVGKELKRGDSPTDYSEYMKDVKRLYGLGYFVGILKAFGKSTFNRSKYLGYSNSDSKENVLSHLLAVCVPDGREGDTNEQAAKLKEMLRGTDIKEQRLIEAGLFSPEWLDIIGAYLGFEGFRSGCYYFMAHMNEEFDDKRKAAIAKFSPISPEEFNAGAFDKNWFDEVYATLGEKRFDEIYDAAKYISDGAKHARARKYADAATGKLDPEKSKEEIEKKRNKDLLMAYAVLPGNDALIRERYIFIRRFIKESKQFGAQRRASEKLAGETAIKNMATALGYPDETRFILKMENEIAAELACFWELQKVGDVELGLCVESGKVGMRILKNGKELKSLPAALKKDEVVLDLQEAKQTFTEQYRRTKIMFEEAMENRTPFQKEEIDALRKNPVLTDMIDALVFETDGKFGLWKDLEVKKGSDVYITHPYTMFTAGVWKDMQSLIFENEIVQPFKQVFRELYVKTEEEKGCLDSRRYAGNQIQTKKTVGVLKNRRWIADIEDGLQKVYYKENIIATIYALADWFSPSDIEAPTLEWVAFFDRKTGAPIKIADVPDILFSEVMRDVDLAVSVAHAGEVDPEMSHSTLEMRRAVAEFTCKSFKLTNVSFTATHAIIKGSREEYSVHLGSGIIHLAGGLMINVLPVHSQRRGRIFLPFVDDDPKTAEVLSKILLFAEDSKIKDPFILDQIV